MLVLLMILVFIYNFAAGVYYAQGVELLPTVEFLYTAAFLCGVVWWLNAEAGTSAVKRVYCGGLLVAVGWLIIIPYHLLKTRGVNGLIPLMALVGSFGVAHISALVVYLIFLY
jgi:hypothetical protein